MATIERQLASIEVKFARRIVVALESWQKHSARRQERQCRLNHRLEQRRLKEQARQDRINQRLEKQRLKERARQDRIKQKLEQRKLKEQARRKQRRERMGLNCTLISRMRRRCKMELLMSRIERLLRAWKCRSEKEARVERRQKMQDCGNRSKGSQKCRGHSVCVHVPAG
eukprot:1365428-Amphidinium_carterae.1